jgi:hypothetical protein
MEILRRNINRAADIVSEDSRMIKGYAAIFEGTYEMFEGYSERIDPKAFEGCDMSDVCALFDHETDKLLARYKEGRDNNTLTLKVDEKGLYFEFEAPDNTVGNDVLVSIKRGDLYGCSFAFCVSEWSYRDNPDGTTERTIVKISKLIDVGPVTFPAYEETEVECCSRSLKEYRESQKPKITDLYYIELELKTKNK